MQTIDAFWGELRSAIADGSPELLARYLRDALPTPPHPARYRLYRSWHAGLGSMDAERNRRPVR